jgi:hypothetical protein
MDAPSTAPRSAADLCRQIELSDDARSFLRDDQTPIEFLSILAGKEKFADAVRVLAHLLPKRVAVWWACRCARQAAGEQLPPKLEAAIKAAETWIAELDEKTRYAAFSLANQAGLGTAAGCAAMAAFVSEGSLAPADDPVVPPPEGLTAQLVAGSVLITASQNPLEIASQFRSFLEEGRRLYEESSE